MSFQKDEEMKLAESGMAQNPQVRSAEVFDAEALSNANSFKQNMNEKKIEASSGFSINTPDLNLQNVIKMSESGSGEPHKNDLKENNDKKPFEEMDTGPPKLVGHHMR